MKPLAVDLFCGLGGWTEGLLTEGYEVIGFDLERHAYGEHRYPAQLVLQDVLTLQGRQFADAALIVASPPCQAYSYRAMPWSRAKALPPPSNELFDACFRIQREAIEAAGRFIPLVVENVRGAQKWVGRSRWNYGSFHLWGDVPALMPMTRGSGRKSQGTWFSVDKIGLPTPRNDPRDAVDVSGIKRPGMNWSGSDKPAYKAVAFNSMAVKHLGVKCGGDWFASTDPSPMRKHHSSSSARKRASAMIAKIPLPLARHIGRSWWPVVDIDSSPANRPRLAVHVLGRAPLAQIEQNGSQGFL